SDWWARLRERPARRPKRAPDRLGLEPLEERTLLNFGPPSVIPPPVFSGRIPLLATADFNGDGRPDLVTAFTEFNILGDFTNFIAVQLNTGPGTFDSGTTTEIDHFRIDSLATADLNGDGKSDLVYSGVSVNNGTLGNPRLGVLL